MSYTVSWEPSAEQELAALWMSDPTPNAVTAAPHRIDERLARDPAAVGESRAGSVRIHFEYPLGIFFRVNEQRRLVSVYHVWRMRRRQP
jgi:hypothetical protein